MSFQEAAIAIGLLTPLILGILAFAEKFIHKKKEPEEEPKVVKGMTVSVENPYASQLIDELTKDNRKAEAEIVRLSQKNELLRNELRIYKERSKE